MLKWQHEHSVNLKIFTVDCPGIMEPLGLCNLTMTILRRLWRHEVVNSNVIGHHEMALLPLLRVYFLFLLISCIKHFATTIYDTFARDDRLETRLGPIPWKFSAQALGRKTARQDAVVNLMLKQLRNSHGKLLLVKVYDTIYLLLKRLSIVPKKLYYWYILKKFMSIINIFTNHK